MKDEISEYVFSFECSVGWENLDLTNEEKVRFCSKCYKNVHFVESQSELNMNAASGKCVFFKKPDFVPEGFERPILGGYILPPTDLACQTCKINLVKPGESTCLQCQKKKSWWKFWK